MNVMYATDDNYAEIMGVSICSLLDKNKHVDEIIIYIVTDQVSEGNKTKITSMVEDYGRTVVYIEKPDIRGMLGVELKTLRWSDSAYSRLFLKKIFAPYPDVNKLLYLDCDTLIVDALDELWKEEVENCLGAACLECMSNTHKKIVGADKNDNYVNTGMLLLNVKKWREEIIDDQMAHFIQKYKGKTEYVDQGVINGTISNRFKLVSPRYNLTCLAYDFTYEEMQIYRKPQFGYSKEEWENAIAHPAVVHFTTSFLSIRPWFGESNHPYAQMWDDYHSLSPWRDEQYRELQNRDGKEQKMKVYYKVPRFVAIRLVGFLHSYVKPILYVIKK